MEKEELLRKIHWLEDKLLRSKEFSMQLRIHNELQDIRKTYYKRYSQQFPAL